jgi:hypothetical protein
MGGAYSIPVGFGFQSMSCKTVNVKVKELRHGQIDI